MRESLGNQHVHNEVVEMRVLSSCARKSKDEKLKYSKLVRVQLKIRRDKLIWCYLDAWTALERSNENMALHVGMLVKMDEVREVERNLTKDLE